MKKFTLALLAALPLGTACAAQTTPPLFVSSSRANATARPYQWRNVAIVGGGFVDGIIFSPKQAGLIYARMDIGGAYRWDASAKHWAPITDRVSAADPNLLGTESIGVDPRGRLAGGKVGVASLA